MTPPEAWRERGRTVELPEGRVFAIETGEGSGTPVLVLHGFPTCSYDFADVAARLGRSRKLVLLDFLGFGFSDKPHDAGYSLFEQADVVEQVLRTTPHRKVHVWAHDMGTSVTTELLARRERKLLSFEIASVVLMNGSVHQEMASLTLGQNLLRSPVGNAFARLSRRAVFVAQMRRILARQPPAEVLDRMWDLLARADGVLRLPRTIGYVEERKRFTRRWIGALERNDLPLLVAWGAKDPVALVSIAERLVRETPSADLVTWDDLGHYPQIEDPTRVAETVEAFFRRVDG